MNKEPYYNILGFRWLGRKLTQKIEEHSRADVQGRESRGNRGVAAEWHLLGWGRELEMTLQSCLRQEPEATSLNLHLVIIQGPNIQAFILWQEGGRVSAKGILDSA